MSDKGKVTLSSYFRLVLLVVVVAAIIYLVSRNFVMSWNIFLAVMGFSAVVFIHECGHFILAKVSDIKVEVFSVFLPPVLLGVRRTESGYRIRILPKFFPKEGDESGEGLLSFTVGKGGKAGETEYRVGLVPVAGYVKMLGQEDVGSDKQADDPRSFGNKSVPVRMAVISAGVIFNVLAAIGILMIVYLVGIDRMPAVVGGVVAGSPAARVGLRGGDEIIEIGGRSENLDFGNILVASALSKKGEKVDLKVRGEDGSVREVSMVAEEMLGMSTRRFGILTPQIPTVAEVSEADAAELYARTGLFPGDNVKAIDGKEVDSHWGLMEVVGEAFVPKVKVTAERVDSVSGEVELIESEIPLSLDIQGGEAEGERDLGNVYSLVPRLRVADVLAEREGDEVESSLRGGDVIVGIGDVANPTFRQMRAVTEAHEDKELAVTVLRGEEQLVFTVVPRWSKKAGKVVIGIGIVLDLERAVVAQMVGGEEGTDAPAVPSGAVITAVGGVEVSNFFEIVREIGRGGGQSVAIKYRDDKGGQGSTVLMPGEEFVEIKCTFGEVIPFEALERLYKAGGVLDAFAMGCKKSVWFIVQTYATLKGLVARSVSMEAMSGPVGIAAMSYKVVEHSFISFLYLLAFISANLAVINFLPIPVVDGGVFVLLIVEKLKGRPVSIRVQEVISYAGLSLIVALFLYLTYNDILNFFRYR
jgi:regulator of sigma E protease